MKKKIIDGDLLKFFHITSKKQQHYIGSETLPIIKTYPDQLCANLAAYKLTLFQPNLDNVSFG